MGDDIATSHPVSALPPGPSSGRGGMVGPGRGLPFVLGHIRAVGTRRLPQDGLPQMAGWVPGDVCGAHGSLCQSRW